MPVFIVLDHVEDSVWFDYFAGQAVAGCMDFLTKRNAVDWKQGLLNQQDMAKAAYLVADAMMAERKQRAEKKDSE